MYYPTASAVGKHANRTLSPVGAAPSARVTRDKMYPAVPP